MLKRIAVVVFATALFAVPALAAQGEAGLQPDLVMPRGCSSPTTTADFATFAEEVWNRDRWRRGKPKAKTLRSMRKQRRCALGKTQRKTMKKKWKAEKRAFYGHRAEKLEDRRYYEAVTPPGLPTLEAIAACESGGDPTAVSPDGSYRGKYQFDYGTWESVGGSGDPAAAPEREQDERAAALYNSRGSSPWPVCG